MNYIDRRLSQDESELIKDAVIHCERENERPIKDMNHFDWEAEFCVVLAKEVKAMKL